MVISSGSPILRRPARGELASLSELCLKSKAWWGYDADFLNACREELTLRPDELMEKSIVVAECGAHTVGIAQLIAEGSECDLLKLFVDPDHMLHGHGAMLFRWAAREARRLGATRMTIEADPDAAPFYKRVGARRIGRAPSGSIPGRFLPLLEYSLTGDND